MFSREIKKEELFGSALLAIVALFVSAPSAKADSVEFQVGAVSITVAAENFQLVDARAILTCHFKDPNGVLDDFPFMELITTVTPLPINEVQGPLFYRIDAEGGLLSVWKILSEAKACRYSVKIFSANAGVKGELILAASAPGPSGLEAFLGDAALGERISQQSAFFRLVERRGAIELRK